MAWNLAVGSQPCDLSSYTSGSTRVELGQNTREMEQHLNLLAKMKQFRNEEKFCDAEVIVNGITFVVHKTVLAAWSNVFAVELLSNSIAHVKTDIHVVYDNVEAFSDFLEFLYSGFVELNDSNIKPLLHIGKNFSVDALVQMCEDFYCSNIQLDNFVANYFLSLKYGLSQLEENISNFVQCNISQVIEQATFLKLTPQKFSVFVKTGKMAVAKQEIQFSLIAGWVGSELAVREKYLLYLLSFVKWINPVGDLLLQIQHTDNIFMVNEFCLFQLLHNLQSVFGDSLGAFTSTYSKLLNLYKFKVPDLLNLSFIGDCAVDELLDVIPITVINSSESDSVVHTSTVFHNGNSTDNLKSKDKTKDGLAKDVDKSPKITIDIGVNTEVDTAHVKEFKDTDSQTFLDSPELRSETLINIEEGESPNLDMVCQDNEVQIKVSSKDVNKSKNHRRKSEPRKVVDKRRMKVENVGNGKIKLKTITETLCKKRGRPRKSESEKNTKKKDKINDELIVIKQEKMESDDNNDNYNAETDDNIDLKEELELWGIQMDNKDSLDSKVTVPDENFEAENDKMHVPHKDRRVKSKNSGKLKINKKLRQIKRPYKAPSLQFKCTEEGCTYSTKTDARLEKHIASIHNTDVKLYCKKCDYIAPLMKDFCLHMKTHISGPPYRCDFEGCKFQAWRMGMLVIHQMNHLGERPYSCDMCTKSFRTANQLSCHKKLHEGRRFVCDVCNKRFTTKGVMKQHRAIHFDKKEYLCDTCGFATKHQSHLISHRKIHTGDLVRCSFHDCNYATPKQGHMTQHLNQHLNIRNHMCQVCGKSFVVRSKLLRHEKIHLDHKLFRCKQCEYTTIRTDRMKLHLTTHGIMFQKKKFNKILSDPDAEEEIDYTQYYEKIESAGTELSSENPSKKQKIESPDKQMDIVNAAMNAAAEGRLLETAYTMNLPRMQMDPISVAAVTSLEEYTKLQSQVFGPNYERMHTFQQL